MTAEECEQHDGGGRNETPLERLDRNLQEMLSELRVVVTGVQVLFAFLLVVPFNVGFVHIGGYERRVYFVTLVLAALAAVCMLAPPVHHRILFRCDDKRHIVFTANRLITTGAIATAVAALPFIVIWFVLPLRRKAKLDSTRPSSGQPTLERPSAAT
jgi:hypothetical protein